MWPFLLIRDLYKIFLPSSSIMCFINQISIISAILSRPRTPSCLCVMQIPSFADLQELRMFKDLFTKSCMRMMSCERRYDQFTLSVYHYWFQYFALQLLSQTNQDGAERLPIWERNLNEDELILAFKKEAVKVRRAVTGDLMKVGRFWNQISITKLTGLNRSCLAFYKLIVHPVLACLCSIAMLCNVNGHQDKD